MRRRWWPLGLLAASVLAFWGWRTMAQEATAQSNPSLLAADQDVIDATAEVATKAEAKPTLTTTNLAGTTANQPPELGDYLVTAYGDGHALVRRREVANLSIGRNEFRLGGIAPTIVEGTARLRPLDNPAAFQVQEQAGGAPLQADALLAAALGREVEVRDGDQVLKGKLAGRDDQGLLLAGDDGWYVHPQGTLKLVAESSPAAEPDLTWVLEAPVAGATPVEATYLASGLTWQADYTLTLLPSGDLGTFAGQVLVRNRTGLPFDKIGLLLSTGLLTATEGETPSAVQPAQAWLPRPISLAAGEDRRFALGEVTKRGAAGLTVMVGADGAVTYGRAWRLPNSAATGLGLPLPAGSLRVYQVDASGRSQMVAQQELAVTAPHALVTIELGPVTEPAVDAVATTRGSSPLVHRTIDLLNHAAAPAEVTVIDQLVGTRVLASTDEFGNAGNGRQVVTVTVPANGSKQIRYQLQVAGA